MLGLTGLSIAVEKEDAVMMAGKPPITDEVLGFPSEEHIWTDSEVAEHVAAGDWTDEVSDDEEPSAVGVPEGVGSTISTDELSAVGRRALETLGPVRPNVRLVATETLLAAESAGHRVKVVWGYNRDSTPEHSAGTALDFMVFDDRAAGDWLAQYLWTNRARLGVRWVIWRQRIRSSKQGGVWRAMADRGNSTQNHMDHPHVNCHVQDYTPPVGMSIMSSDTITEPAATASVAQLAKEVIAGKWGNGQERIDRLRAAGHDPVAVQAEVRRRLGVASSPPPFPVGLAPNKNSPSAVPLQRQLKKAGFLAKTVRESPNYGPATQEAVAAFLNRHPQFRSSGVTHDVSIGPKGWAFLFTNF